MSELKPSGLCRYCGKWFKLKKDGTVRTHGITGHEGPCPGADWEPIEVAYP